MSPAPTHAEEPLALYFCSVATLSDVGGVADSHLTHLHVLSQDLYQVWSSSCYRVGPVRSA